jgi:hypothetical protein
MGGDGSGAAVIFDSFRCIGAAFHSPGLAVAARDKTVSGTHPMSASRWPWRAGQVLDRALKEAGIDRGHVYVTNAVKHFKFERRGKRRIQASCRIVEEDLSTIRSLGRTEAPHCAGRSLRKS